MTGTESMLMKLKKAGKIATEVLLALLLAVNLITMAFSVLGLREPLKWMPVALLSVSSGSMEPVFSAGDGLVVLEIPYDELKAGDIVTFHRGNELISHEIIGKENNRFITKGTANNYQDDPIGPEEYCAKAVCILPHVGWFLDFFSKPLEILLLSVFLTVLLCGRPVLACLYGKIKRKSAETAATATSPAPKNVRGSGRRRVLALFALISVVALMPFITAAKYTARINAFAAISAASISFTSNYLSGNGNDYFVQGWNGTDYTINLRIRNYSNDLLMNMEGQDLYYGLCVVPVSSDGTVTYADYGDDYTVSVTPKDSSVTPVTGEGVPYEFPTEWPSDNRYGPFLLTGSDDMKLEHQFTVQLTAQEARLAANEKVRFKIFASTSERDQFFMELLVDFTFQVRQSTSFIAEKQIGQSQGATLVTYLIRTNLIDDGSATKNVQISWDTSKLYLNEFESAAFNIISGQPGNYNKTDGTLIMPMQAFSSVTLQFFKISADDTIEATDLTADIITG